MIKIEFLKKYNMQELTEEDNFVIDIVYNTNNNFTGKKIYKTPICMLRIDTAKKLIRANKELNRLGYKIKIWDAFRPLEYQRLMWNIYPDERFVTNPDNGNSNHCKGNAVDITLCTIDNKEVKMPTKFDHFGIESYRSNYHLCDEETKKNVILLENIMIKHGFVPFKTEWWHFNDVDTYEMIEEMFD